MKKILIVLIVVSLILLIGCGKYSQYNNLTPKGKCEWKAAEKVCEEYDYEFGGVYIFMNSVTAKCMAKDRSGRYIITKIKLCPEEIVGCIEDKKEHRLCNKKEECS